MQSVRSCKVYGEGEIRRRIASSSSCRRCRIRHYRETSFSHGWDMRDICDNIKRDGQEVLMASKLNQFFIRSLIEILWAVSRR